jgi:uncharacterized protein
MRTWCLSDFTIATEEKSGHSLLYNSFMGAIARLSPDDRVFLDSHFPCAKGKFREKSNIAVSDETICGDVRLAELARGGFLVPSDVDERSVVGELLAKERDYGFHLILLPHEDCNFRCTYCYEKFERGKMKADIKESVSRLVNSKAGEYKIINVGWFGGEPCLALDIIKDLSASFKQSCLEKGAAYRSSMTTNGYFLNRENFEMLIDANVEHFQITLDGRREDHDAVRHLRGGQPTYDRIVRNLVGMSATEGNFSVAIRVNFSSQSLQSMQGFIESLAATFAGDDRFFLDFHAMGKWGGPNDNDLDVVDASSAHRAKMALGDLAACSGFQPAAVRDALQPHGSVCYAGKDTSVVIGSDGRLYKCTVAFTDPRNHVGWLREGGILEIDRPKWQKWVDPQSPSGKCGICSFSGSCQSRACPLAAMDEGEPPCPYSEDDLADMIRAAATVNLASAENREGRRYVAADA